VSSFSLQCPQRLLLVGPIAVLVLLFIIVAPTRTQTNNYEFNDSHFHSTNNVQGEVSIEKLKQAGQDLLSSISGLA